MGNVVNLRRGKMTAENLAHEIPWKELEHVYLIAECKDGRTMIAATPMDPKTLAFFKMISEDVLAEMAHIAAVESLAGCVDPNCTSCGPTPPPPPSDKDPNGEPQ